MFKRVNRTILTLAVLFVWNIASARAGSIVSQTDLDGKCIPQFKVELPVFGPAGSTPRVNALFHNKLTVTMKEIDQAVLPVGMKSLSAEGCPSPPITFQRPGHGPTKLRIRKMAKSWVRQTGPR